MNPKKLTPCGGEFTKYCSAQSCDRFEDCNAQGYKRRPTIKELMDENNRLREVIEKQEIQIIQLKAMIITIKEKE